ncbi:holin family protein [Pelosinus sp. sgz500959]|uniref:phage holin family protein n=1 Tax=Pelosinus sp. sgz500959 TaxID=3242472 RepID=UPI0036700C8B
MLFYGGGGLGTKTEYLTGAAVSFVGTALTYAIGGFDQLLIALVIFMVLDYLTGIMAAYECSNLSSKIGFKGIIKKIFIFVLVVMAHQIDLVAGQDMLVRTMVTWFFLGNEGLSILENAAKMGVPVPGALKEKLVQLTEQKNK